jgi:CRISPR associated protein Cas1
VSVGFGKHKLLHSREYAHHLFDSRASPLSSSPRLAANPVNAILNYLYALLESECRLAVAALGLDPEMGLLHMDTINRDSLACDLMEPIRPDVDAYVLKWITHQPLKKNWFFEERNGNCRLMADLASQLAQTTSTWARLVAPLAEWIVKEIASTTKTRRSIPATRLTQNHKRALTGGTFNPKPTNLVKLQNMCNVCGNEIQNESEQCRFCAQEASTHRLTTAASKGRLVSHSSTAEAKRSKTRKANHAALREWSASDQPPWLTEEFYAEEDAATACSLVEPRDCTSSCSFARLCQRNSTWSSATSTALEDFDTAPGAVGVK